MKTPGFLFVLICFANTAPAQGMPEYATVDRLALSMPDSKANSTSAIAAFINANFDTEGKKVRAAYTWVITHIHYSNDSLHRIILNEDRDQMVTATMKRRKGVCENFSAVFTDICGKASLKSFVVEGYTKQGNSVDKAGHAWCAVLVDHNWALYDPTWDAGSGASLAAPVTTHYFQVAPSDFIATHMPFDPMFQFLDYPVTFKEFNGGSSGPGKKRSYFNYTDSVLAYDQMDPLQRYASQAARIEKNGPGNDMIRTKISQLKMEMEIINQDRDSVLYNGAVTDYNSAISLYNSFLTYRNNRFKPVKTDAEVGAIFEGIEKYIIAARSRLEALSQSKATLTMDAGDLQFALEKLSGNARQQQVFFRNNSNTAKEN